MESAVFALFCASLVVLLYGAVEYVRTTRLARRVFTDPVSLAVWASAFLYIVPVVAASWAAMMVEYPQFLPEWLLWTFVVIGWLFLLDGLLIAWLAAHFSADECRQRKRLLALE